MLGKTSAQIEPSGWGRPRAVIRAFSQVGYLQKRWIIGGCKNLVSLTSFRRAVGSPKQLRVIATIDGRSEVVLFAITPSGAKVIPDQRGCFQSGILAYASGK